MLPLSLAAASTTTDHQTSHWKATLKRHADVETSDAHQVVLGLKDNHTQVAINVRRLVPTPSAATGDFHSAALMGCIVIVVMSDMA
ncbi:hypothetical protein FE257_007444 [Aspergillus nanangensis]|uniref:Uncharacterized protein n=1 Tax=Aspergillus nanangensis TaxID=2582783 RepID=A0AAD4GTA4_ASPNN|nr:hypothetical protein FE257_007444 [Aspergillus nanangensis]